MTVEASELLSSADGRGEGMRYLRADPKRADLLWAAGLRDKVLIVGTAARNRAVERKITDSSGDLTL